MVLASHNTMSYLKPAKWYLAPFNFMSKCQSKTIQEQYEAGARLFDLRLVILTDDRDFYLEPSFAHGLMAYKSPSVDEILSWLNSRDEKVYVRFLLERPDPKVHNEFRRVCEHYEQTYTNIGFWGHAYDKKTWTPIYTFKGSLPRPVIDKYASCNQTGATKWKGVLSSKNHSGLLIDDLWPWLYAKLHNKKNREKYKDEDVFLLQDFIK